MKKYPLLLAAFALAACVGASGPQKTLDELASAMSNNNSQAFLALIDMPAFAESHIKNMTRSDDALSSLNALGQMFGLGNLEDLIGNVVDMQGRLSQQFNRGVASGELMAECRRSEAPNCPWVPESLRNAKVAELGPDAAIAKITTPAQLTSWLALRKINGKWLVTGQAVLEATARAYAMPPKQAPQASPGQPQDATRI